MTTAFPSERSKDLYAALKGRKTLVEVGLQTTENEIYLDSRAGQKGVQYWSWGASELYGFTGAVFGIPSVIIGGVGLTGVLVDGATTGEIGITAVGFFAAASLFCKMGRVFRLENRADKAQPKSVNDALFNSLRDDLESISFSVLSSDSEGLSFTTQHGVVVAGENSSGDLVMLLNGQPMRLSYEEIAPAEKEFITSVTGQKIPVRSGFASVS